MFKKSVIGAYCNIDCVAYRKGRAPFLAMAELKQAALGKILMPPILIRRRAHQIVEHVYRQTAHFFMSQNDHRLVDAINFDYASSPLPRPYS